MSDSPRKEPLQADNKGSRDQLSDEVFAQNAFSQMKAVEPSATLQRLVAQIPLSHPKESLSLLWPFQNLYRRALALGLAAALGVVTGGFLNEESASTGSPAALATDAGSEVSTGSEVRTANEAGTANEAELTEEMDLLFALATASDWDEDPWALSETVN